MIGVYFVLAVVLVLGLGNRFGFFRLPAMLRNVKPGDVISFKYTQAGGGGVDRTIKVTSIRDTLKHPVSFASEYRRPHLKRTRFLITGVNASGQFRSFYEGKVSEAVIREGYMMRAVLYCIGHRYAPTTG